MPKPIPRKIQPYRPKTSFGKRVVRTAAVAGLAAATVFGGIRFNAARKAELNARADFFSKHGAKNVKEWVALPVNAKERFQLRVLNARTFNAVERQASRMKLGKGGIKTILDTLWSHSDILKGDREDTRAIDIAIQTRIDSLRTSKYNSPREKAAQLERIGRVVEIREWAGSLPVETQEELLDLVRAARE
ncbi:MAG: hypothetical protein Q7R70_01755 [Candidatus Diapherotrites archaeon]|nr:hypothetical protein [Candidatus Diapherotrites archaeon]